MPVCVDKQKLPWDCAFLGGVGGGWRVGRDSKEVAPLLHSKTVGGT